MRIERRLVVTLIESELKEAVEQWIRQQKDPAGEVIAFRVVKTPKTTMAEMTFSEPVTDGD